MVMKNLTPHSQLIMDQPALSSLGLAILVLINSQENTTYQALFNFFKSYSPTIVLKTVRYLLHNQFLAMSKNQQTDPLLQLAQKAQSYLF